MSSGLQNNSVFSQEHGIFSTITGELIGEHTCKGSAKGAQKQCFMPVPQDHIHQEMGSMTTFLFIEVHTGKE